MTGGPRHRNRPRHRPRAGSHRTPGLQLPSLARGMEWAGTAGLLGLGAAVAALLVMLAQQSRGDLEVPPLAAAALVTPADLAPASVASPTPNPAAAPKAAALPPAPACEPVSAAEGDLLRHTGPLGAGAIGASALGCAADPVAALPPTELELTEPELLYSLITREQPIEPLRYAPEDLVTVQGGPYQLRAEAAAALEAMLTEAEEQGHPWLVVSSGFRDYETQAGTHQDWANRVGAERAAVVSAVAGHSEHQLGLAVDVGGECGLYDCFGSAEDGLWVAANAHRWGFIIRYPEGGEEVTGYAWEPWHLRYVGPRAAWQMHVEGEIYWERMAPTLLSQG